MLIKPMLLYYITDRLQFPGNEREKRAQLLHKIAECVAAGVHYIQLREKDLRIRELQELGAEAASLVSRNGVPANGSTRLMINSRVDVALACGAAGVHLPANDLPASEARAIFGRAAQISPMVAASCHTVEEVARAEAHGADFAVFGPVFEKRGFEKVGFEKLGLEKNDLPNPNGLTQLEQACNRQHMATSAMPVLALGGITLENAGQCRNAGAAGIAAIRLFQQNNVDWVIKKLLEGLN